jgi:hypothetical protein
MNLGHFCNPSRNHYPNPVNALDLTTKSWQMWNRPWPVHEMCRGMEVLEFGTKREQIVACECECHTIVIEKYPIMLYKGQK